MAEIGLDYGGMVINYWVDVIKKSLRLCWEMVVPKNQEY